MGYRFFGTIHLRIRDGTNKIYFMWEFYVYIYLLYYIVYNIGLQIPKISCHLRPASHIHPLEYLINIFTLDIVLSSVEMSLMINQMCSTYSD